MRNTLLNCSIAKLLQRPDDGFNNVTMSEGRRAKQYNNVKRGFTIIELMIYSVLVMLLLAVLSSLFISILDSQLESESTSAVVQDERYILSRMAYDIYRASDVTTPASEGTTTSTLAITVNGQTYTYALSGGKLTLADATGTDDLSGYGTTVSNLQFTRRGNAGGQPTITVSFRLESIIVKAGQPRETKDVSTTIGLRQ